MFKRSLIAATVVAAALAGCEQSAAPQQSSAPDVDFQKHLITQLVQAKPGDVIEIPEGHYELTRGLSLNGNGVTIRGAGMDKTVLSFKNQIQGAEGLLVKNADNFILEDLALEDAKGDALKINEGENVIVRRVRTEWTNGPDVNNGAYGIYPVQTTNVLIEDNVAIAASDAGIYVGQSHNIIVRGNRAEYNVAGIEIENSIGADVYNNTAKHNTGGILVFNMPNLPQPGHGTRVYDNIIHENNTENFAPEGTAVSFVPAGSGVMIVSNDQVEVFSNDIKDNDTSNILVSSYFTANDTATNNSVTEAFDQFPESIYIYGNTFTGGGSSPDHLELKALRIAEFGLNGSLPDILWDGVVNPEKLVDGELPEQYRLCIDNEDASIINVDAGNGFANISTDITPHQCQLAKLDPIKIAIAE